MFKFSLPVWAAVDVELPTGTTQRMIHVGGGQFVSALPPLVLDCDVPLGSGADSQSGLPVTWDSAVFGERGESRRAVAVYDVAGAMAALRAAEVAGDVAAITTMRRVSLAQQELDASAEGER